MDLFPISAYCFLNYFTSWLKLKLQSVSTGLNSVLTFHLVTNSTSWYRMQLPFPTFTYIHFLHLSCSRKLRLNQASTVAPFVKRAVLELRLSHKVSDSRIAEEIEDVL